MASRPTLPRRVLWGGMLAIFLFALGSFINSVDDWIDSRNAQRDEHQLQTRIIQLNHELECRFELAQPVEEAQAVVDSISLERQDALAQGLVALVDEDPAAVQLQTDRIEVLSGEGLRASEQLLEAIQARAAAVATCQAPSDGGA